MVLLFGQKNRPTRSRRICFQSILRTRRPNRPETAIRQNAAPKTSLPDRSRCARHAHQGACRLSAFFGLHRSRAVDLLRYDIDFERKTLSIQPAAAVRSVVVQCQMIVAGTAKNRSSRWCLPEEQGAVFRNIPDSDTPNLGDVIPCGSFAAIICAFPFGILCSVNSV